LNRTIRTRTTRRIVLALAAGMMLIPSIKPATTAAAAVAALRPAPVEARVVSTLEMPDPVPGGVFAAPASEDLLYQVFLPMIMNRSGEPTWIIGEPPVPPTPPAPSVPPTL
jgi:hypothetical protein